MEEQQQHKLITSTSLAAEPISNKELSVPWLQNQAIPVFKTAMAHVPVETACDLGQRPQFDPDAATTSHMADPS